MSSLARTIFVLLQQKVSHWPLMIFLQNTPMILYPRPMLGPSMKGAFMPYRCLQEFLPLNETALSLNP